MDISATLNEPLPDGIEWIVRYMWLLVLPLLAYIMYTIDMKLCPHGIMPDDSEDDDSGTGVKRNV